MKNIFTILISMISLTTFGQNWDEMIKVVASDRSADDNFGYNVVIDGNRAVVSSDQEDENASGGATLYEAGSVYVFELNGNVWSETAKLVASDRASGDKFGARVDISGDRIIIGSYLEDEDLSGNNTLSEAGSAYIFELNSGIWTETAKIVASDRASGARFGFDVSIYEDKAIVGAYYNATDTFGGNAMISAGAAYIFELNSGVWTEKIKLVASDRSIYNYFGYNVDMDETRVAIGAQGNLSNKGAVYIFEPIGGIWTETAKLVSADAVSPDNFGFDAALSNNRIVIGAYKESEDATGGNTLSEAGSAYVFDLVGGVWTETAKLVASDRSTNNQFGFSVDISFDKIVIGSRNNMTNATGGNSLTNAGSAYIYEFTSSGWIETAKLVASDRGTDDNFGSRVNISGNIAIIGALFEDEDATGGNTLSDAGSVYIYITCPTASPNITVSENTLSASVVGATYQWLDCSNGNTAITGETNQTFTATVNGDYSVVVTEANCSDTSSCVTLTSVAIDNLNFSEELFNIYPNPANDILTIDSEIAIESILVKDISGKSIYTMKLNNYTIDISNLTSGIYFLEIQANKSLINKKFIKN